MNSAKEKILILEEDANLRNNICKMFELEGYKTFMAKNVCEAELIINSKKINLIISDWMAQKMEETSLLFMLKKSTITNSIPIIIISNKSNFKEKITALELGADDYLIKPIMNKELYLRSKNKLSLIKTKLSKELLQEYSNHELQTKDDLFLLELKKFISENYNNENLKLSQIAEHFIMGKSNIQKYVKKQTGKSIFEIIFEQRLIKAHELILEKKLSLSEIAGKCGFKNSYYFTRKYKAYFGNLPSKTYKIN